MKARLEKLEWKRMFTFGAAVIILMGGVMSTAAKGVDKYIPTRYEHIDLNELMSVYKRAYVRAGFKYRNETTEPHAMGGGKRTTLYFEFSASEFPNSKGIVSIYIDIPSPIPVKETSTPFSVDIGRDLSGVKVHGAMYDRFSGKMESTENRAVAEVEMKLQKHDTNRAERDQLRKLQQLPSPPGLH